LKSKYDYVLYIANDGKKANNYIQVRSKDLQVKIQLVLRIFILFKVTR